MMSAAVSATLPLLDLQGNQLLRALGVLSVHTAKGQLALPLASVDIQARVADRVAQVTLTQGFRNTYTEHLEAVFTFPLAGGAAVSGFELQVGDRVIVGKVEERAEARRQYQQALDEGKRAALLEKERDDVFTVAVGNLPPGEEVLVRLTYSEKLPYFETGGTELRLPLVVAPRYIPGHAVDRASVGSGIEEDTDQVPDASRISPPRLADGLDPNVSLGIQVEILAADDKEAAIAELACSQHATQMRGGNGSVQIALARDGERLNRDFVLRWRLAGDAVRSSLLVYTDAGGASYGMLSLVPPHRKGFLGNARDVVFLLDRSGSMGGVKMSSAARACSHLLRTLEPRDRFALMAFDDRFEWMQAADARKCWVVADEEGVERGEKWLRGIDARGGTEIDGAMNLALTAIRNRGMATNLPIIVLLTDGQVGNESAILKRLQTELDDARVFTVGIDTAVNQGFLQHLANSGGGTAAFVAPGENLEAALQKIGREIGEALVTDVELFGMEAGLDDDSIAPNPTPDLFAGRATTAFFRIEKVDKIKVKGRWADGKAFSQEVKPLPLALPAIAQLWARARVADLEDRFRVEPGQQAVLRKQIVELAVKHQLLTRFTAFVVVDHAEIVNAEGARRTVVQPVEMPAQWEMQAPGAASAPASMGVFGARGAGVPRDAGHIPPPPMAAPAPAFGAAAASDVCCERMVMPSIAAEDVSPGGGSVSLGPPPARSAPLSRAGGLLKKGGEAFKQTLGSLGRPQLGRDAELGSRKPPEKAAPSPELQKALQALEKALRQAKTEIEAGRVPSADDLEKARKEALAALAASPLATRAPLLARFLRSAAVELVSALRSAAIDAASLVPLFDKQWEAFDLARQELAGSTGEAFWLTSI